MESPQLFHIIEEVHRRLISLSATKGVEYTQGDDDRLANFKRAGESLGLPPLAIWMVYSSKHFDSIQSYVKDAIAGKPRLLSEPIEGRAMDLILYLVLFIGLVMEHEDLRHNQFTVPEDCTGGMPGAMVLGPGWKQEYIKPPARAPLDPRALRCPKHNCNYTETITDDHFCGVCRQSELETKIRTLQLRVEELEAGRGQYVTINQSSSSVEDLQVEIKAWADQQFPDRTAHHALSKLVLEEIPEFLHGGLDSPGEYADLMILLLDIASLRGISVAEAVREKMAINRARRWAVDPGTGIAQHIITRSIEGIESEGGLSD